MCATQRNQANELVIEDVIAIALVPRSLLQRRLSVSVSRCGLSRPWLRRDEIQTRLLFVLLKRAGWMRCGRSLIDMPTSMLTCSATHRSTWHLAQAIINASSSFLIDMPTSMLLITSTSHHSMRHLAQAIINASSSFLIDMPISMPLMKMAIHHFIAHHRMAIINASSSFLIDMPISMLVISMATHLFILHQ